jgi:hypothetical protein
MNSKGKVSGAAAILVFVALAAVFFFSQNGINSNPPPAWDMTQVAAMRASQSSQTALPPSGQVTVSAPQKHIWGKQTKTSGCLVNGALSDQACTPGDIFPDATTDKICQSGYASSVRNVPESEKNKVYAEYGIASHTPGQYEVDHLVSLELGGSNDISNLWPEAASPKPGFHEKDKVENYLHDQVCAGKISLQDAQLQIATNWLDIYNNMAK